MSRILAVERERGWQRLIGEVLAKEYHQITRVAGAAAALVQFIEHDFDLLLVDGRFSYDFLNTCWLGWPARLLQVGVLVTPADKEERELIQQELRDTGVPTPEYLLKPYSMEMLRRAVRAALTRKGERVLANN